MRWGEQVQLGLLAGVMLLAGAGCGSTAGGGSGLATDGGLPDGGLLNIVVQETILVVDSAGVSTATDGGTPGDGGTSTDGGPRVDSNLVNPWGIVASTQGPFWISDNGTGHASILDASGSEARPIVTIPPPAGSAAGATSAPTGVAFNSDTANFKGDVFIFATEDGTIAGWQAGNDAVIRVDNSQSGAVYKGIAIANNTIFATNFHSGAIDMFDANYAPMGSTRDPNMQSGFAPFNVANINSKLYVTFAKQDSAKRDDVPGAGNGFIDTFDAAGGTPQRLVSNGVLNSPWGMALAPSNFGAASGKLLVGNFGAGDGRINVFDPTSGAFLGRLSTGNRTPLAIDGLWGLSFGNGGVAGPTSTLFFTAGPGGEEHGAFGKLELVP